MTLEGSMVGPNHAASTSYHFSSLLVTWGCHRGTFAPRRTETRAGNPAGPANRLSAWRCSTSPDRSLLNLREHARQSLRPLPLPCPTCTPPAWPDCPSPPFAERPQEP